MLVHLVARAAHWRPFSEWKFAARAWAALRVVFPLALAVVLMPNHAHVIAEVLDEKRARVSLAHALAALTRSSGRDKDGPSVPRWEPVPRPVIISDPKHLSRQVRYVALNPCRSRLVGDPLEWEWSTHRDVVGAIASPWVAPAALAAAIKARRVEPAKFIPAWHAYVSGDPTCDVSGTPPPRPAPPADVATEPLGRIAAAALAATRAPAAALRHRSAARRLFINLAWRQGWRQRDLLARACGVTPHAVGRLVAEGAGSHLEAGALCLGDDRLVRSRAEERRLRV